MPEQQQQPAQTVLPQSPQQSTMSDRKLTEKNSYSLHDKGDSYQNVLVRLGMAKPGSTRP